MLTLHSGAAAPILSTKTDAGGVFHVEQFRRWPRGSRARLGQSSRG